MWRNSRLAFSRAVRTLSPGRLFNPPQAIREGGRMRDPAEIRVVAKSGALEYLDAVSVRSLIARCVRSALRGTSPLPPAYDVDDLVQEVHIALWRRQQRHGRPFTVSYVFAASRAAPIDCLRHATAQKRGSGRTGELSYASEVCEPAASAEDRLLADERLYDLLTRLRSAVSPRMFEAVRLRCIEGESANEAGARLGMSESGVNTAMHRARYAVRRARRSPGRPIADDKP